MEQTINLSYGFIAGTVTIWLTLTVVACLITSIKQMNKDFDYFGERTKDTYAYFMEQIPKHIEAAFKQGELKGLLSNVSRQANEKDLN